MYYQTLLDKFTHAVKEITGEKLTGIYLHGSLAMGCFHPEKSDIDLIVVVSENLSDDQKGLLMQNIVLLNKEAPAKGLEISVVKKEFCKPFVYPTPFELHFSRDHLQRYLNNPADYIEKMHGVDKDLAAHFTVINHYGIVLWGEKIEDVFSEVPKQDYADSIYCDIENAQKDILNDPVYIVLNLCRVLAFLTDSSCLSKKDGGIWGMTHLPQEFRPVISDAVNSYTENREMTVSDESLLRFAEEMLLLIREKVV